MHIRPLILLLATLFSLSAVPAKAGPKEEMLAADKAFSDLSLAKGPHAAFLAYMTDDVRLYDGDHPPIVGKKAVAAYYARVEKAGSDYPYSHLKWTPKEAVASPDGSLGTTRGTWVWTTTKPAKTILTATGYYVTEWRRQPDGSYKFDLDIGGAYKTK